MIAILKNQLLHDIYINKAELIYDCRKSAKQTSLAIFKPAQIVSFHIETANYKKSECETYKLPFKFYYKFKDDEGKVSRLQIIDWEIGEFTRKLLQCYGENYKLIKDILRHKYFTAMQKRDVYLFLGTSREWYIRKSPNPFMIIGIFYPPYSDDLKIENNHCKNISGINLYQNHAVQV